MQDAQIFRGALAGRLYQIEDRPESPPKPYEPGATPIKKVGARGVLGRGSQETRTRAPGELMRTESLGCSGLLGSAPG